MLVLSRKAGEKLVIDGNIVVTVTRITGGRVTIGIDAPREVRVARGELIEANFSGEEGKGGAENDGADPNCGN